MSRLATIKLMKESMGFSAGHFTIFSNTSRSHLHGHNYQIAISITTWVGDEGLSFDYRFYIEKCRLLCQYLDETVLIPSCSKHISINEKERYYHVYFSDEEMVFLKRDIKLLPVTNITVEELSSWFIDQLKNEKDRLRQDQITSVDVQVFSGKGQSGGTYWEVA